jgi:hypothetical protein
MKAIIREIVLFLFLGVASISFGAVPQINVTVADSSGKTAFKGTTDTRGILATPKLQAGNYAVQFNSKNAPKGSHYTLVIVAGTKKTSASAITGEKLATGGVAMKIEVGAGLGIMAQVSEDLAGTRIGKNGKLMVWIPKKIGSNLPAHWAESDSAEAKEAETSTSYSGKNMQDKYNQGKTPQDGGGSIYKPGF